VPFFRKSSQGGTGGGERIASSEREEGRILFRDPKGDGGAKKVIEKKSISEGPMKRSRRRKMSSKGKGGRNRERNLRPGEGKSYVAVRL